MRLLNKIKYSIVRKIETNPSLNLMIYNNVRHFKFLFPHEKDYLALKLLFENKPAGCFLDVGTNIGLSSIGFRVMGFDNKILMFEPNTNLCEKYLKKIQKQYKNIEIFNFGLSNKNESKTLFVPEIGGKEIHYNGSFDKSYVQDMVQDYYSNHLDKIEIIPKPFALKRYDDLALNEAPVFIKIDVEGFDHFAVEGMLDMIKKHEPVMLIEFNESNFGAVYSQLKETYDVYIFDYDINAMIKVNLENMENYKFSKRDKEYTLSSRNLFYIPKNNGHLSSLN